MPAARARLGVDAPAQAQPRADAYTGMLVLSLVALMAGCLFLYLDYSQYEGKSAPPKAAPPAATTTVPATGGATGPGAGGAGGGMGGMPSGPGGPGAGAAGVPAGPGGPGAGAAGVP